MDLNEPAAVLPQDLEGLLGDGAFAFQVEPPTEWSAQVLTVRGVEELSRPYHFDMTLDAPWGSAPERSELLHARARLVVRGHSAPRIVQGVIASVRVLGAPSRDREHFRVRLVPLFALLAHSRDSRVFQDLSVPEVVSKVLSQMGVDHTWKRMATYAKKPYCVQYQESDLAFVSRLLAEEGFWYAFEPGDHAEKMVIADHATHYPPIPGVPELLLAPSHGLEGGERLTDFSAESAVRPSTVRLRRYDYQRPGANIVADASVTQSVGPSGAPPPSGQVGGGRLRVYDHLANYEEETVTRESAPRVLDRVRRNAESGRGSSNCCRLTAGAWFKVTDSTSGAFDGQWTVTRVEHRGQSARPGDERPGARYENDFRCVPSRVHHAPKLPARRLQHGLETASVVGGGEEEIHTDELGRVKVQFHWDLAGGLDERSSAWLRVVQGWSGKHAGIQFIPRVGTEVVVGFLGGDTDRPVVVGSLYNGTHAPPFKLPLEKTRSGFRTTSSPGGAGHNELSFEDAAGSEQVRIHAQRDLDEVVLRDRNTNVGADLNVIIAGNSTESVGGERVEVVRGGRASTVMGDASRHVVGNERAVVDADRVEVIRGTADLVAERLITRVSETEERVIHGDARASISGDHAERVEGCVTLQVGRAAAQTSYAVHVEGVAELHGRKAASLSSEEEITLSCGRSFLRLTPDQIELVAPRVLLSAEGAGARLGKNEFRMRATGDATVIADTVVLRGERASLGLDVEARLGGDKIKLGQSDNAEDFSPDEQPTPTRLELVDQEGQPLAYRRYKLLLADGSTRAGILDRNGVAVIDLEQAAEVLFDDVQDLHAR